MATKKKLDNPEQLTSDSEPTVDVVLTETKASQCGHANMQHYGTNGRLEKIVCDLPDGHAGDHHAKYTRNAKDEPETDSKGRVLKLTYHEEEADAWWNDEAGRPARAVDNDALQTSLLQKDLIMQVMKESPHLTIEQAMAKAKALPQWNALS
jgi:hypothetical protein